MFLEFLQHFHLRAFIRLTRLWNLIIIGLAQYSTAAYLISFTLVMDLRLLLLSASTIMIAAAGYIINDYYDIKIDLINKPERVVIGKNITRRYAIFFHSTLSVAGIAIGIFLGWKIGIINFVSAFFLWWYSNNLKRLPFIGNLMVAFLTGLSIYVINILFYVSNPLVVIYALFAFFMTWIREVIKDMEDLKGDNAFGCKTLPIIYGIRKTKYFIYFLLVVFISLVVTMTGSYTQFNPSYLFILLFIPLMLFIFLLIRADTKWDFYLLSQICKLIFLLGVLSMVFIRV